MLGFSQRKGCCCCRTGRSCSLHPYIFQGCSIAAQQQLVGLTQLPSSFIDVMHVRYIVNSSRWLLHGGMGRCTQAWLMCSKPHPGPSDPHPPAFYAHGAAVPLATSPITAQHSLPAAWAAGLGSRWPALPVPAQRVANRPALHQNLC